MSNSVHNNNYSLYIPAIGNMSQEKISRVFWEKCVGIVSRIDYFQNNSGLWCAFVHFDSINNNSIVETISNEIIKYGSYKFWFNDCEYLILRQMVCKKIPETHLNIHQIAASIEEKDEYILSLQNAANDDKNKIAVLEGNISVLKYNFRRNVDRIVTLEESVRRLEEIVSQKNWDRDEEMEQMVTSLVGPRWTEEDDMDARSPVFVAVNESKFDDDGSEYELDFAEMM